MKKIDSIIYCMPRVLAILFVLFISLFALDIFGMGYGFWGTIVGLFMHLIPSFIFVIFLLIFWKRPQILGIVFLFFSFLYLIKMRGDIVFKLPIFAPSFLTGILFLVQYFRDKRAGSINKNIG